MSATKGTDVPRGDTDRARRYRERGWWPGIPLADHFEHFVRGRPGAPAVLDERGRRLSREALWREAGRLEAELAEQGIGAGDVVLVFMPNRVEWLVAMLAALRRRAVPASLPVRTDEDNLRYAAALCRARAIVTVERHERVAIGELACAAAADAPDVPAVATVAGDGSRRWTRPGPGAAGRAAGGETGAGRPRSTVGLDHLMFTSSTTGRPKAVMHTGDTVAALNVTFAERFGLGPEAPIFMPSPLGHSVGTIHGARLALYTGAPLILQERWDPRRALETIATHRCRFTAAATPFLKDLLDAPWPPSAPAPKLAPVSWFLCGGAQVPPSMMELAETEFPDTRVSVLWGMTEGGLTTCTAESPREKVLATAGVGLPGLELRTLDEHGAPTPPDTEGELAMRGPGVFFGYYAQDGLYASLLTADGFFRTGDLARIDEDGYLRITGRLKDLIIRGGVNISPVPAEDAIAAFPGVRAVAVVGYPDERLGERICAVVETTDGAAPPLDALTAFLRERGLPKHLWPELVRSDWEFPRTAAGKIRKAVLRDRIVAADRAGFQAAREAGTKTRPGRGVGSGREAGTGRGARAGGGVRAGSGTRAGGEAPERAQPREEGAARAEGAPGGTGSASR